jgi:hypothetical protein
VNESAVAELTFSGQSDTMAAGGKCSNSLSSF